MLFAKFYSPQWILWVIPWLVLWARTPLDVAGIVVFDLTTYAYFPYLYYMQDKHPLWFPENRVQDAIVGTLDTAHTVP
jgi:hypothetical protein